MRFAFVQQDCEIHLSAWREAFELISMNKQILAKSFSDLGRCNETISLFLAKRLHDTMVSRAQ